MAKKKSELDKTPDKDLLANELVKLQAWESMVPNPNAKTILSLDPGIVNLGICLLQCDRGQFIATTSKIDLPKLTTIGARVSYIMAVVDVWIVKYNPDIIVKEGPSFSTNGMADSGRVQFALEYAAYKFGIPLITIAPMTMRSFLGVSAKGKDKSDTKLEIFKRYGLEFASTDEADSFGLAVTGQAIAKGEYIITKAAKKSRKKKVVLSD